MTDPARPGNDYAYGLDDELVAADESVPVPEAGKTMPVAQALGMDQPRKPPSGCAFSKWLFGQQNRPDLVGQLAHVVARDPTWRGADTKEEAVGHLRRMGARKATADLMGAAFDEFTRGRVKAERRVKARAKRVAQKAARKKARR